MAFSKVSLTTPKRVAFCCAREGRAKRRKIPIKND
jgi:hypothetical protein